MKPVLPIVCSILCSLPLLLAAAETNRFNILFCFADDWGRYASCYAKLDAGPSLNQVVRTPNIDRVAREGAMFATPLYPRPPARLAAVRCSPDAIGGTQIAAPFCRARSGIRTSRPFRCSCATPDITLARVTRYGVRARRAGCGFGGQRHAYEKAGRLPNNFSEEASRMVSNGLSVAAARERILDQVRGNFDAFLADRKPGQAWLYWFGPTTTHRTWIKGSGKKLWDIEPEALKGKLSKHLPDVPELREDLADYLGECQAYDAYIGVLLKRLEETGELERTVIVISGDHGMPGVPGGKCNLYDLGTAVALVARWPGGQGGRVVEDFVNLMDLAPTFMEVGGVKIPAGVDGRSILPQLTAKAGGQIDPSRDYVVTGRERHVGSAREGNLPYPMRALRTKDFIYIRNFAPDRWPMGAPYAVTDAVTPSQQDLENNTRVAFPDMDAGPAKAWVVARRAEPEFKPFYDRAFAKRPAEELYDLRSDPDQVRNVAGEASYLVEQKNHAARLMRVLRAATDPRVIDDGGKFDRTPFTDPENVRPRNRPAGQ